LLTFIIALQTPSRRFRASSFLMSVRQCEFLLELAPNTHTRIPQEFICPVDAAFDVINLLGITEEDGIGSASICAAAARSSMPVCKGANAATCTAQLVCLLTTSQNVVQGETCP
jgi:hypothetical protein